MRQNERKNDVLLSDFYVVLAEPKTWRKYRTCWCPTPQDCSPCQLRSQRSPPSSPKVPKCVAPADLDLQQTTLLCPLPSSGLVWYQNIQAFQEAHNPKG